MSDTSEATSPLTPAQVEMMAAALDLATRDVTTVANGLLTKVHRPQRCSGEACWVHSPSPHHMVEWPVRWRPEKRTAERVCPHGLGHPDPDDVAFNSGLGRDVSAHGCDGCCR